jgi:hypothetical protein
MFVPDTDNIGRVAQGRAVFGRRILGLLLDDVGAD